MRHGSLPASLIKWLMFLDDHGATSFTIDCLTAKS